MRTYRKRLDIIAAILRAVTKSAGKTQIMYQANLSHNLLQKYLTEMTSASLINYQEQERRYVITGKGWEFLETYDQYYRSCKFVEKHQQEAESRKDRLLELGSAH